MPGEKELLATIATRLPAMANVTEALQLENWSVVRGQWQLEPLSLTIPAGQWVCVIGANGSGKSSLLQGLAHLLPTRGVARLGARPLADLPRRDFARDVGWLGQEELGLDDLSVLDTVLLGTMAYQGWLAVPTELDRCHAMEWLDKLDLLTLTDRRLSDLSGGERQRALVARAFATGCSWLLLDEPLNHLDPAHQRIVWQLMVEHTQKGGSVVSVVHDLNLALRADLLLALQGGRMAYFGSPRGAGPMLEHLFGGALVSLETPMGTTVHLRPLDASC